MFSRDAILDEIERRVAEHEDAIGTHVGEYRDILRTRIACLSQLRAFIIAQPAPEASALVKEARGYLRRWEKWPGDVTLEPNAPSLVRDLCAALEAAEAQNAGMRVIVEAVRLLEDYRDNEPKAFIYRARLNPLLAALKALDEKT